MVLILSETGKKHCARFAALTTEYGMVVSEKRERPSQERLPEVDVMEERGQEDYCSQERTTHSGEDYPFTGEILTVISLIYL